MIAARFAHCTAGIMSREVTSWF